MKEYLPAFFTYNRTVFGMPISKNKKLSKAKVPPTEKLISKKQSLPPEQPSFSPKDVSIKPRQSLLLPPILASAAKVFFASGDALLHKLNKDIILQYRRHTVSFNLLSLTQGFSLFALVMAVGLVLGTIFFATGAINPSLVIKDATVVQTSQAIAGQPVSYTVIIKRSAIGKSQHFVQLPKGAKRVSFKAISQGQARTLAKIDAQDFAQTNITSTQRQQLAASVQPAKNIFARAMRVLSASIDDTVSQVSDIVSSATSPVTQTSDASFVDLSALAPTPRNDAEINPSTSSGQGGEPRGNETEIAAPSASWAGQARSAGRNDESGNVDNGGGAAAAASPSILPTDTPTASTDDTTPFLSPTSDQSTSSASEIAASPTPVGTRNDENDYVQVDYQLPAPTISARDTNEGQQVTISAPSEDPQHPLTDVVAFTTIPEIFKVGQEDKIKIKWKNQGNQEVSFHAYDTNHNGKLDYVEWTVPHLSTQTFDIIFISKAFQLDTDQTIIADIYDTVSKQDGNYASIDNGQYVRVTFEHTLGNQNDITLVAKPTNPLWVSGIEVYPVYTDSQGNQTEGSLLTPASDGINPTFDHIDHDGKYRILLSNLQTPAEVFDLKIIGGIDFDYIVDPTTRTWDGGGGDNNWSTAANWSGDTVPATTDAVLFDGTSTKDCTIDNVGTWSGGALTTKSGYTGTITQNVNITTDDFGFADGTWTPATGVTLDIDGSFTLSGGTFTAPDATGSFLVAKSFAQSGSPTFTANGGTVTFDGSASIDSSIDASGVTFSKVILNRSINSGSPITFSIISGTTIPLGNSPTVTISNVGGSYNFTNGGTITAGTGTLTVNVNGTFTNNGTVTANSISSLDFGGDLTNNGTFSATGATTFDFDAIQGSRGHFTNNAGATFNSGASPTFDIEGSFIVSSSSTFPANTALVMDGAQGSSNTSIDASGYSFASVTINRSTGSGSTLTLSIASGTTANLGNSPTITLNSTFAPYNLTNNGTMTMGTGTFTANIGNNFTNNGTVTANNLTGWSFNGNLVNNGTISATGLATFNFSHYNVGGQYAGSFTNNAGGTFSSASNPTFTVEGSFIVSSSSTFPANTSLTMAGNAVNVDTSLDASGYTFATPVTINRTNSEDGTQTFTIASGTSINLGNSPTITVNNSGLGGYHFTNNGTITVGTGTLTTVVKGNFTNTGTITANSITAWSFTYGNFINSGTFSATGLSTFDFNNQSGNGAIPGNFTNNSGATFSSAANPTFTVAGSFIVSSSSTFPANATLTMDGSAVNADTSLDASGYTFATPVTINRTNSEDGTQTFTIASGTSINVGNSATITVNNSGLGNYNFTNNGTITAGTGTLTATIKGNFTNNVTISTGASTVSFSGTGENFTNAASSTFTSASNPAISIKGNLTINSSSTFPATLGSITFNGTSGTQTVSASTITNWGDFSKTAGSGLTLASNMTVSSVTFSGGDINNPASAYTIFDSGNFSQTSTGTLGGANLTIEFNGTGNQTISKTAGTFSSLLKINRPSETAGTTAKLLTALTTTGGSATTTVTAGTFYLNGQSLTSGGTLTVQSGGTLQLFGNEVSGGTAVLNSGSNVIFTGNGDSSADIYTLTNVAATFYNVTVNSTDGVTDTFQLGAATTVNNNVVATAGTLSLNGNNLSVSGSFSIPNGFVLQLQGGETVTTPTLSSGSTVTYTGGTLSAYTLKNWTYSNLTINNDPAANTLGNNLLTYWKFDESSGNGADSSGNGYTATANAITYSTDVPTVNFSDSHSFSFNGSSSYVTAAPPAPTLPFTISFWIKPTSSTPIGIFDSAPSAANTFRNYPAGNFEWWSDSPDVTLGLTANTWQYVTLAFSFGTNRTVKYYRNGSLITTATGSTSSTFAWSNPIRIGDINSGGDGRYNGLLDDFRIYNRALTASEVSSLAGGDNSNGPIAATFSLPANLTVNGNFTITAGTVDAVSGQNYGINLAGNWSNSGTFTAENGTVTLTGTNQKIFGNTTFYNLTKDISAASADTLMFQNTDTQTIATGGLLSYIGASGKVLTLRSCNSSGTQSDGTQWKLTVNGSSSVTYVDVKDSDASGGNSIIPTHSTNSLNNINWIFNNAPVFTGGPSDNGVFSSPTNVGSAVAFTGTATDEESNNYYLAICKTNAISANVNAAPTCTGGNWCISSSTVSGNQASCNYTAQAGDAQTNAWYAFVCDHNNNSFCSPSNQGIGSDGSPFEVNHAPSFSATSNTGGYIKAGNTVTFTSTASDADTGDTVALYVCKVNDFSAGACGGGGEWCHSSAGASNPSCNYTVLSGDGDGSHTYYANIIDSHNFGSSGNPISHTFNTDVTNPTTTDDYTHDGVWVNSNQTITLTPADATSGVASTKYCTDSANTCDPTTGTSYTSAVPFTTEGITYFRYESTDNAGNVQTTVSRTIKLDKTKPTTTDDYAHDGAWVTSDQTITLTPADATSSVASTKYCTDSANTCDPTTGTSYTSAVPFTTEGITYFRYESTDNAGNVQTTVSRAVKIDKTKPTTTDSYGASDNVWQTTDQSITLTPADATSSVASTKYCTDSANTCDPTTGTSYTGAVPFTTEGITYFRYESTDNAGNVQTTVSRTVKIDKTKPTTTDDYVANDNVPQTTAQTITLTPADAVSGVAATSYCIDAFNICNPVLGTAYSASVTISTIGTSYFRYESTDTAGNIQDTVSRTVIISAAPTPTPTPTGGGGGNPVTITFPDNPQPQTHAQCGPQSQCVSVAGSGSNQCQLNTAYADNSFYCITLRYICNYISCSSVGVNLTQCLASAACLNLPPTHSECNSQHQCALVNAPGISSCQADADCRAVPSVTASPVVSPASSPNSSPATSPASSPAASTFPAGPTSTSNPSGSSGPNASNPPGQVNELFPPLPSLVTHPIEIVVSVADAVSKRANALALQLDLIPAIKAIANIAQKIMQSPSGLVVTKVVTATGLLISLLAAGTDLFASPLSFPEIFLIPLRLFSLLSFAFGTKKRHRPWGTVYDSQTLQPLDPAYVVLKNIQTNQITTAITDVDGRYGFLAEPGRYVMMVSKTNYAFPSQHEQGRTRDQLYDNLYFGQEFSVLKAGDVIVANIPMDPVNFNWNEFAKKNSRLMKFHSRWDLVARRFSDWSFVVGFFIAIVAFLFAPYPYNTIILAGYLLMLLLRVLGVKPKSFGYVTDALTGQPLSFAVIRIFLADGNVEIGHKVADQYGRYYCLVPKGRYKVTIEKRNSDGSYSPVHAYPVVDASKSGIIKEKFEV